MADRFWALSSLTRIVLVGSLVPVCPSPRSFSARTGLRMRSIERGTDHAVLTGMLAWGLRQAAAKQENTITNVLIVGLSPRSAR